MLFSSYVFLFGFLPIAFVLTYLAGRWNQRAAKLKMMNEKTAALVRNFPRQALHAVLLGFDHPVSGQHLSFKSQYPDDIAGLVCALEPL